MVPKYSMSASGGNSFSIVLNVVLWLVVIGICFLIYRFVSRLFGSSSTSKAVSDHTDSILKHSSDRMSNGSTYMDASAWLFDSLIGKGFLTLFKDVDEDRVGEFLLMVKKAEFKQLESTYILYKREKTYWLSWSYRTTLIDDIKLSFNDSQQQKYLSHLL